MARCHNKDRDTMEIDDERHSDDDGQHHNQEQEEEEEINMKILVNVARVGDRTMHSASAILVRASRNGYNSSF